MRKISGLLILISCAVLLTATNCKKACMAGSGGEVSITFKPEHHSIPIYGSSSYVDTVYIKFNQTDFPGPSPSNYDLIVAGNPNENFVKVNGLKCGQYFVFVVGFDTSAVWNTRVVGGLPIDFSETSGEKTVIVPVSV